MLSFDFAAATDLLPEGLTILGAWGESSEAARDLLMRPGVPACIRSSLASLRPSGGVPEDPLVVVAHGPLTNESSSPSSSGVLVAPLSKAADLKAAAAGAAAVDIEVVPQEGTATAAAWLDQAGLRLVR